VREGGGSGRSSIKGLVFIVEGRVTLQREIEGLGGIRRNRLQERSGAGKVDWREN